MLLVAFLFLFIFYMYVCVCLYTSVFVCVSVCLWRPEESVNPLGVGVTSSCEPPDVGAGK